MFFPKVYIIIINWNGLNDTIECLESLKKVTYINYKVVVVDNASKNNEAIIFRNKFADYIHLIQSKSNLGFTGGNNVGIEYAIQNNADYVLLLNNDTVVSPDFLSLLMETFNIHQDAGIVGPKIYFYSKPNMLWTDATKTHLGLDPFKLFVRKPYDASQTIIDVDWVVGCCLLCKTEVIKKIGMLCDDYYILNEETDFCLRARKAGYKIKFCCKAQILHKVNMSLNKVERLKIYYATRNLMVLYRKHGNGMFRYYCYFFSLLGLLKNCGIYCVNKKERGNALPRIYAYIDFMSSKFGKTDRLLN